MRNKITSTQKRWLLSVHILCTVAWLGAGLCSLVFNITALLTHDPHLLNATYVLIDALDRAILRGGAAGVIITGILLAALTHWGLLRFYWIIIKEIVSVICIIEGVILSSWNDKAISLTATQGLHALHNPLYLSNQSMMFVGIFFQLIAVSGVIVISVFKPWGQRKRPGQRGPQKARNKDGAKRTPSTGQAA